MGQALRAERLTIYLSQAVHKQGAPDYVTIVGRARRAGLACATVFQGLEGYGRTAHVHRRHAVGLGQEVPVTVTVIDTAQRLDTFLSGIEPLLSEAVVVRNPATVLIGGTGPAGGPGGRP